jgi:hypothetical protein
VIADVGGHNGSTNQLAGSSGRLGVPSSPGLYYQHETEARLFSSEWRTVTYLNLQQVSDKVDVTGKYLGATVDFCKKHDKTLWPIRTVPKTCSQKISELKETLWIPLKDNFWIHVAPATTRMTILCSEQIPTDIQVEGSGILTFLADCTVFGNKAMIRSLTSQYVNHTQKDIIPPLYLPFNCGETSENRIHLDEMQLETPLKNIQR